MKKLLVLAVLACVAMTTAVAQIRVEAGYLTTKEKAESGDPSDASASLKLGGYYMMNDLVIEKSVVECGVTFTMGSRKEDGVKLKYSNLAIPVNAGYKIEIADEFSVRPYAGINLKFNTSYKFDDESLFDDVNDALDPNRFQLGGQLGAVVQWKNYTAGYQYQHDFSALYTIPVADEKVKTFNSAITVGIIF